MRLLRARGSAELRKVVSCSARQGLWLRNGKVGSQVRGIDRSRFPRRRTVRKVRRGGRRERRCVCHASALALAMTDKALREVEM